MFAGNFVSKWGILEMLGFKINVDYCIPSSRLIVSQQTGPTVPLMHIYAAMCIKGLNEKYTFTNKHLEYHIFYVS